jgi:hypothetical protein
MRHRKGAQKLICLSFTKIKNKRLKKSIHKNFTFFQETHSIKKVRLSFFEPTQMIKHKMFEIENRYSRKRSHRAIPWLQFAFKDSMIHWILQFAWHIAFRCVLHRCENQDIQGIELFYYVWLIVVRCLVYTNKSAEKMYIYT